MPHEWRRDKEKGKLGHQYYWRCNNCGSGFWKTSSPNESQKVYLSHLKLKFTCEELILKDVMWT